MQTYIVYIIDLIIIQAMKTHLFSIPPPPAASVSLQSEKRLVTMTRKDLSHNVLEVEHTEGIERWLVVKTTVQPEKVMQTH